MGRFFLLTKLRIILTLKYFYKTLIVIFSVIFALLIISGCINNNRNPADLTTDAFYYSSILGVISLSIFILFMVIFMYLKSRNSGKRLEKIVAERTNEIIKAQENLLIAEYNRKIAEHSNQVKNEFLARMSHEMLTPMNAIVGFAELAKTSGSFEQIMSWIDKINDSAVHLLTMLRNMLDVSEGSGAFTIVESQFYINSMIKNAINKTNPDRKKKKQKLYLFISHSMPETFIGDEKRIPRL